MEPIFVFGSNALGQHVGGAAAVARRDFGAKMGVAVGLSGRSYAIATIDTRGEKMHASMLRSQVDRFIEFATTFPELTFKVTQIGCGIAGFTAEEVAPLFADAPANCTFDRAWEQWLPSRTFWGTFDAGVAHNTLHGVPMIAMTPERIAALHTLDDAIMSHRGQSDEVYAAQRILMAMLAEAGSERAS